MESYLRFIAIAWLILLVSFKSSGQQNISYSQDFGGFVFEQGSTVSTFGEANEWTFQATGSAASKLDYLGDWGTGTSAGFRGNQFVMGYQHTTTTGIFSATLTLPNNTGEDITFLTIAYTGKVERVNQTRYPEWTVTVNGQPIPDLAYSTAAGVYEHKAAEVSVAISPAEDIVMVWSSDNGPGIGSSRQIGIGEVMVVSGVPTQVSTPVFDPPGGSYTDPVNVQLSVFTPGANIHYTTNGETPGENDLLYDGNPIPIEENTTLKARAFRSDLEPSEVATAQYIITGDPLVIVGVENPEDIQVDLGTPFEEIPLPETVMTCFDDGTFAHLYVDWDPGNYNPDQTDTYTLTGTLQFEEEIINPDNIQPEVNIIVTEISYAVTFFLEIGDTEEFDPYTDEVYLTGSWLSWAIPGTLPGQQLMQPAGSPGEKLFTLTTPLPKGNHQYRYYINSGIGNPEGTTRTLLVEGPMEVHDTWMPTSAQAPPDLGFIIFPNPAVDYVNIFTPSPLQQIRIATMDGRILLNQKADGKEYRLPLHSFSPGIYLIQVNTLKKTFNFRLIIGSKF